MSDSGSQKRRVAAVTGGSRGIGRAVVEALLTEGWQVHFSSLAAASVAEARGVPTHVGGIYSSDVFYDERPDLNDQMTRHGILGVEMEAAELYALAARHGRRALAVLTVSDHLITGDALPADQRERSFGDMVEIALEAAFGANHGGGVT